MAGRRKRGLRPEEEELWRKVARGATPLGRPRTKLGLSLDDDSAKPAASDAGKPRAGSGTDPIQPFEVGQKSRGQAGSRALMSGEGAGKPSGAALRMDRKSFGKMKRGKLRPEGRIDLHGMTLDQAQPALTGFILEAHARGKRLVLVITGKGRTRRDSGGPVPERGGVLRRQVPLWLGQGALKSAILQVTPAHISHGGEGAYYVYLARRK